MKKIFTQFLLFILIGLSTVAQVRVETFTNITTGQSNYASRTWIGDNGLTWNAEDARTDQTITGPAIAIRVGKVTCSNLPGGIGSLTFTHKQVFGGSNPVLEVYIGATKVGTINPTTTATTTTLNNINISGTFNLEIKQITGGLRVAIDDINWTGYSATPCVIPTAQPTALNLTPSTHAIDGSFTAAAPAADAYLVVRSTSATLGAVPTNTTNYSIGQSLGNGTVVSNSAASTFSDVALTPSTTYYYFIFSFNNSTCSGGPLYLTTGQLTGNSTTLTVPNCVSPSAPSNISFTPSSTSISGNFTASGASKYLVVQTSVTPFTGTITNGTVYPLNSSIGNGKVISYSANTNFTASGLTPLTTYYYFVFAANDACVGEPFYSNTSLNGNATTTDNNIPPGYYSTVAGLSCAALKTELSSIITAGHTQNNYGSLDDVHMPVTDSRLNDAGTQTIVYDIYSDNPTGAEPYEFSFAQFNIGSGTDGEGNGWNKEHSFPNSWFSATSSTSNFPGADLFHLYPTDMDVNSLRGNYPYGMVATPSTTTANGSKLGTSSINFPGYTGPVFEPIDAYKGDLARTTLYMVTRYQADVAGWENLQPGGDAVMDGTTWPSIEPAYLQMLLSWHNADPVSAKELKRNDDVYGIQHNRNPFIDHPEYVDLIWGNSCLLPIDLLEFNAQLLTHQVQLNWKAENPQNFSHFEIERSTDAVYYHKIGQEETTNSTAYQFTDAHLPQTNTVFYRLKMVDVDGHYLYSKVVTLTLNSFESKVVIYPNPVSNLLTLKLPQPLYTTSTLSITDATGRVLINNTVSANLTQINTKVSSLAAGQYFISIKNAKQNIRESFIIIR